MVASSGSVCEHIRRYYAGLGGPDPVLWHLDSGDFPSSCSLAQQDSSSGDQCHYNIVGLSNNKAGKLFKRLSSNLRDLYVCEDGEERPLTLHDVSN